MNDSAPDYLTDDQVIATWIRRGVVHPPLLSWAWPGAAPRIIDWPLSVHTMRWHLWMDHCEWHFHWPLEKMQEEHDWIHHDPVWSHARIENGAIAHVHGTVVTSHGDDEGEEWEW